MKRLALSILSATAVAAATAGIGAPQASALFSVCSNAASPGCHTLFDGYRSYIETRSSKTGGAAASICTSLTSTSTVVTSTCANESTFIRTCYGGGALVYGSHWGSSSAWVVDGRDATISDATTC